ncbi:MAG: hypothetical protein N3G80_03920 [Candidatus Micrarchaeota archaeon]|nr:hypothetical protein [Candidatus Micrarchaeota archaeon]
MQHCLTCGVEVEESDSAYYPRGMLCIPCYVRKSAESVAFCSRCGTRIRSEEIKRKSSQPYCSYCAAELERKELLPRCRFCNQKIESFQERIKLADQSLSHTHCAAGKRIEVFCSFCKKRTEHFKILPGGSIICPLCYRSESQRRDFGGRSSFVAVLVRRLLAR